MGRLFTQWGLFKLYWIIVKEEFTILTIIELRKIEETYSKWKKREVTGVLFMEMLELKKNTF